MHGTVVIATFVILVGLFTYSWCIDLYTIRARMQYSNLTYVQLKFTISPAQQTNIRFTCIKHCFLYNN